MFEFDCILLKPCLLQPCFHVAGLPSLITDLYCIPAPTTTTTTTTTTTITTNHDNKHNTNNDNNNTTTNNDDNNHNYDDNTNNVVVRSQQGNKGKRGLEYGATARKRFSTNTYRKLVLFLQTSPKIFGDLREFTAECNLGIV